MTVALHSCADITGHFENHQPRILLSMMPKSVASFSGPVVPRVGHGGAMVFHFRTQETEAEGLPPGGDQAGLHSEFRVSLGYVGRPSQKAKTNNNNNNNHNMKKKCLGSLDC